MKSEARFWSRIQRADPDACWLWSGAKRDGGYGNLYWRGRYRGAHQVAYELEIGEVPPGMQVLHRCDNPPCCNPAHLFIGTNLDNIMDRVRKRRGPVGSRNPMAVLDETAVLTIRTIAAEGFLTQAQIAAQFGVDEETIGGIARGEDWKDIGGIRPMVYRCPHCGHDLQSPKRKAAAAKHGHCLHCKVAA